MLNHQLLIRQLKNYPEVLISLAVAIVVRSILQIIKIHDEDERIFNAKMEKLGDLIVKETLP